MELTRIDPGTPENDLRTFECAECQHIQTARLPRVYRAPSSGDLAPTMYLIEPSCHLVGPLKYAGFTQAEWSAGCRRGLPKNNVGRQS
jgi:hypothetical protein